MRSVIMAALLLGTSASALAGEAIDLSKPWGNKDGCANRVQQEYYSETMLLLTPEALVTASSACQIGDKTMNADGSWTLATTCESEGEASVQPATFGVRQGEGKDTLQILDATGALFGEVSQCR